MASEMGGPSLLHSQSKLQGTPPPLPPLIGPVESTPDCSDPFAMLQQSPQSAQGPWPDNLIELVARTTRQSCLAPKTPEFVFKLDNNTARESLCVLEKHGLDLRRAIESQKESPLGYSLEFRPTGSLEPIFGHHPNWSRMKAILENGLDWPLADLSSAERKEDLEEALEFGNHKSAESNPVLLRELVEKDVTHGYGFPLPLVELHRVPGALLAPMNIMKQNTINQEGRIVEKDCLAHGQSYEWRSGTSVNSRVDKDSLLPCKLGSCMK